MLLQIWNQNWGRRIRRCAHHEKSWLVLLELSHMGLLDLLLVPAILTQLSLLIVPTILTQLGLLIVPEILTQVTSLPTRAFSAFSILPRGPSSSDLSSSRR